MRKGRKIQTKQAFAVVVDGETEKWYLEKLKYNEPDVLFNITPKILQKKNINQQYEYRSIRRRVWQSFLDSWFRCLTKRRAWKEK